MRESSSEDERECEALWLGRFVNASRGSSDDGSVVVDAGDCEGTSNRACRRLPRQKFELGSSKPG